MTRRKGIPTSVDNGDGRRRLLTVREASELLRVHANTLRRWSDERLVTCYRIGPRGDRRFKLEDIAALLVERMDVSQTEVSSKSPNK